MLKKFCSCLMVLFLSISLITFGTTKAAKKSCKIKVCASFYPVYYFATQIGGNKADVKSLIPSGVEPHDWEPKIKDIQYISDSKILIYSGAGMETWISKITEGAPKSLVVVDSSKGVKLIKNTDKNDMSQHGAYDPHIWNSPKSAQIQAKNIKNAFVKVDPKNKKYYLNNYNKLIKKLNGLDAEYKSKLKGLRLNKIVTAHAAFAYMCKDYNLKQISIENAFAEGEPTPKEMAKISIFCKKYRIKYVFSEDLLSPKSAQTIAKEANAKNLVLNPLESAGKGQNYFSIMEKNLNLLVKALK